MGELGEEEYERCLYRDAKLRPAWGDQVFYPRYAGTGYKRDRLSKRLFVVNWVGCV